MSEPPPPHRNGITAALSAASETLMRVMPPAFLLLLIFNVIFLATIAWVFDHNADVRNAMLTRIVEQCLLQQQQKH